MADSIASMLRELCLKVREEQVGKLFQMVASLGEKEGRSELITTLQAISKVMIVPFFISAYVLLKDILII